MQIIGLLLVFITGLALLMSIKPSFSLAIKIGFAFNIGIGLVTVGMFISELLGISITVTSSIVWLLIFLLASIGIGYYRFGKDVLNFDIQIPQFSQTHFAWLFFFGIICYTLWAIGQKALYFPVIEYDSIAGYDFMAKVIAKEGTFRNSLVGSVGFLQNARFLYPPMVSGSSAFSYLIGFDNPKIIILLQYISFAIGFYGLTRNVTSAFAAIMITSLMLVTPEMLSHAALSLTNLPDAIYVGTSIIAIYSYIRLRDFSYLILGSLLMAFNMWTRTDGIAFLGAAGLILLIDGVKNKEWKAVVTYSLIAGIPFLAWTLFIRIGLGAGVEALFVKHPHWDAAKFGQISTYVKDYFISFGKDAKGLQLYGITFILFYFIAIINIKKIWDSKDLLLPLALLCWFFYTFIYYQMDYDHIGVTLESLMKASYKRGVFCLVPIAWFFIASNDISIWLFQKLDSLMNVQNKQENI